MPPHINPKTPHGESKLNTSLTFAVGGTAYDISVILSILWAIWSASPQKKRCPLGGLPMDNDVCQTCFYFTLAVQYRNVIKFIYCKAPCISPWA